MEYDNWTGCKNSHAGWGGWGIAQRCPRNVALWGSAALCPSHPSISCTTRVVAIALLVGGFLTSTPSVAWAQPPSVEWRTTADLKRQLAATVGLHWEGKPTRAALSSLSDAQRVAVVLDRRIDPDRALDAMYTNTPTATIFAELAKYLDAKYVQFGPVALIGPTESVSRIRTLALLRREEARALSSAGSRRYLEAKRSAWDTLAEPRELVRLLGQDNGVDVHGLERIPHDLWPATDLPPLSLVDRLTLILNQFDLTFAIAADGSSITLTPTPDDVSLVRKYPGSGRAHQTAARWAERIPRAQIKVVEQTIYVKGLLEEHERITQAEDPDEGQVAPPASTAEDRSRFTIDGVRATLGDVLASLAPQLKAQAGVEIRVDRAALRAADISLDQQVTISVREASLNELLDAILQDTGCTYRRLGSVVEIVPQQ